MRILNLFSLNKSIYFLLIITSLTFSSDIIHSQNADEYDELYSTALEMILRDQIKSDTSINCFIKFSADDSLRYSKILEYLKNSSDLFDNQYLVGNDKTDLKFCISNIVLDNFTYNFFISDIVQYEYNIDTLSENDRSEIRCSLKNDDIFKRCKIENMNLFGNYSNYENCDLLVFLGKMDDNKIIVNVLSYRGYTNWYMANLMSGNSMQFLFYFKGIEITKVFFKNLAG